MAKGLKLQGPFKGLLGYPQNIAGGKSGSRDYMYLYDPKERKGRVMSMARFNYAMETGTIPSSELHVDHISENRHDDDINDLQLLTPAENNRKSLMHRHGAIRLDVGQPCQICGTLVYSSKVIVTCSRACNAENLRRKNLSSSITTARTLDADKVAEIRRLRGEGKSSYLISTLVGVSRNTVMKYW